MAELITRGNHAELQHDDEVTTLRISGGKGSNDV